MSPHSKSLVAAAALIAIAAPAQPAFADADGMNLREQLVGTWTLRELYAVTWDEQERNAFGASPQGRLIFDRLGNVTCVIVGADRPKFAHGDRLSGTPQENQAAVHATQAVFGKYRVDADNRTVVFEVERSLFPNWDGTAQPSVMTIEGDTLNQTKRGPRGSWGYAVWERVSPRTVALKE